MASDVVQMQIKAQDTHHPPPMKIESTPILSLLCGPLCLPCFITQSWFVLNEGEQKIVLNTGVLVGEAREPGCYFFNFFNREIRTVSTKKSCTEIKHCKVADRDGNPIIVSAVVVAQVVEPRRALLDVQNLGQFVEQQAMAVVRQTLSHYAFESTDGSPSIRSDTAHINDMLAEAMNAIVKPIGVRIISFRLDELSYAPEIATIMLKRQAAKAVVEARKIIVDGAVQLAQSSVEALHARGIKLTEHQKGTLMANLLTVLCATETEA
eukprot:m.228131 g.228131  ORF g.228131 m.228131 type:complete len:266 (+) comp11699_c0_seq1:47-844(+)